VSQAWDFCPKIGTLSSADMLLLLLLLLLLLVRITGPPINV
jgi:hypothetical protein